MKNSAMINPGSKLILSVLYLGWIVSYIDRTVVSLALSKIGDDMSLSAGMLGIVLSAFFMGYAFMQIPGGWLADKYGSRRVIIVAVICWSIFTAFTGLAWSLASLLLVRFLFGVGEGGYPAASTKAISDYFPAAQRTKAQTTMMSSNALGAVMAPIICTPLLVAAGWRHTFLIVSCLGLVVVACFVLATRRAKTISSDLDSKPSKGNYKELLSNSLVWKVVLIFFFSNIAGWGLSSWMPTYLINELGIDLKSAGYLVAIPGIISVMGMLISGRIMDRIGTKVKYVVVCCTFVFAIFLYLVSVSSTITEVIVYQSIATFCASFTSSFIFTLPHRYMKEKVVGTAFGMINFGGQAAGILSPMIMGFLISASGGSYTSAFMFLTVSCVLAALTTLTLPSKKQMAAIASSKLNDEVSNSNTPPLHVSH
ncbi:MFS transporter [Paenibacillus glycanilyticus]|uniref:MFS transporter n=1 Tax=Paenibacillus glycanilyticus TaxID=126569 RepID=A0ABQ6GL15_9BACL|nr:MFS transporter [Paenibacillus glycanilyticus]GLX70943.1 MFS transporter [Paenibacillus glycanilyticus]